MPRPEDLCTRHLQRIFITLLFNYQRSISLLKARKHVNRGLHALQRLTVCFLFSTEPLFSDVVEVNGIEPMASCVQGRRSPS